MSTPGLACFRVADGAKKLVRGVLQIKRVALFSLLQTQRRG